MEFLTLLIVLGLLQLWGSGGPVQQDQWFYDFSERVKGAIQWPRIKLLVIVGLPVLLVLLLQGFFESLLFGLLSLLLFVGVLLFSLGRGDFSENIQSYLASWSHGNFESAYEHALAIGDFKQGEAISNPESLHEHVRSAILYEGYERWFAVIFWFLLLGPAGALGYRLSYLAARSPVLDIAEHQLAMRFVHYLDWVPARLLALTFALAGNFHSGFGRGWQSLFDNQPIDELLVNSALPALTVDSSQGYPADPERFSEYAREELLALQALLSRSVVGWLIVIALAAVIS